MPRTWLWLLPVLLAALGVAGAAASVELSPHGIWTSPALALLLLALAFLGALHRPLGGAGLGLGALAVIPGVDRLGVAPTALLAPLALLGAELAIRAIEARRAEPLPERRQAGRVAAALAIATLSALAAGAVYRWLAATPGWALAAAVFVWTLPPAVEEVAARSGIRRETLAATLSALLPLALDLAGLALGWYALVLAATAGWGAALGALALFALLAGEAARNGLAAAGRARRLEEAHRLRRAGAALASGGAGLLAVAEQIRAECAGLVPFTWLELALDLADQGKMTWCAEAGGRLTLAEAQPPPAPPPLAGIHRRSTWRVEERRLEIDGAAQGRLRLWCDPRRLEARDLELFDGLVPQMAASLRTAFADRAAKVDRLTGAATRRVLDERLEAAFARSREEGGALAVVLCDIDHFKRINDSWGHAVGDRALQAVAEILLAPSRGDDLCARFGGEEFVLLFEEMDGETALEIAERLRRRVESLAFASPEGTAIPVTLSAGVAAVPELAVRSAADLLQLADQALYTAKHLGRNVCLLDVGQGRLRTPKGDVVEVAEGAREARLPVFFA